MTGKWKLGIGVYDTFDRHWSLCRNYSKRPYDAYSGTKEELIQRCIEMNRKDTEDIVKGIFNDHYGVIEYQLSEHGLISKCREVWCPYSHKGEFGDLIVVSKQSEVKT